MFDCVIPVRRRRFQGPLQVVIGGQPVQDEPVLEEHVEDEPGTSGAGAGAKDSEVNPHPDPQAEERMAQINLSLDTLRNMVLGTGNVYSNQLIQN